MAQLLRLAVIGGSLAALALGALGCGGASSPRDLFARLQEAYRAQDGGKIYDLLSDESRARLDSAMKRLANFGDASQDEVPMLFGAPRAALADLSGRELFIRLVRQSAQTNPKPASGEEIHLAMLVSETPVTKDRTRLGVKYPSGRTFDLDAVNTPSGWRLDGQPFW